MYWHLFAFSRIFKVWDTWQVNFNQEGGFWKTFIGLGVYLMRVCVYLRPQWGIPGNLASGWKIAHTWGTRCQREERRQAIKWEIYGHWRWQRYNWSGFCCSSGLYTLTTKWALANTLESTGKNKVMDRRFPS